MSPRTTLARKVRLLLPLATAAILLVFSAPAQAHDALESSNPANGSTVSAMPAKIELTFDHTPIAINSIVRVEDASGTDQADGPVEIVDNQVSQPVKPGAPQGKYKVVWRVVSSDGHPIEGTFTFTAGGPNSAAPPTPAPSPTSANPGVPWPLVAAGIVGAVLVIGLVVAGLLIRRRLRNPEDEG
ncbi:copper resistance CopC family protein [Pseudarthrobacter niigatensis]|uniref:Methionine-rich copper-binding protein CopC n=1 Tax=Pseudarthrobacter niigatensis TaxID=369935 RepID=A0AAJ1SWE7_9MICC|nr:copper resistance protein CopC [Pseudarthrobacter niigatensis]MDQ0145956.1 methionine-rich copper-binding protein CopC [Pseudarthrobacter niigatensis]MDQ0266316.1 methionine-rich copper-binding protein CopC [Pseudarthrobacter niigatensis]